MAKHNELGIFGETLAKEFLMQQGYTLQAQNWTWGNGELDLVMWDRKILVFIEVKTRTFPYFGDPQIAVTEKKQESIYTLASEYMHRIEHEGEIRFDIISITMQPEQKITHYTDAFFPTW